MKEIADFDPEATRLARVNPTTGVEIPRPKAEGGFRTEHQDMTVLHRGSAETPPTKKTTEVIPVTGARASGEATSVWEQDEEGRSLSLVMKRLGRFFDSARRRRIALLAVSPIVLGLALLPLAEGEGEAPRAQPAEARGFDPAIEDSFREKQAGLGGINPQPVVLRVDRDDQEPEEKVGAEEEERAYLERAVNALLDGRLEVAGKCYATLAREKPEDMSVVLASRILAKARSEEEK